MFSSSSTLHGAVTASDLSLTTKSLLMSLPMRMMYDTAECGIPICAFENLRVSLCFSLCLSASL
jgi:hypothetical protein